MDYKQIGRKYSHVIRFIEVSLILVMIISFLSMANTAKELKKEQTKLLNKVKSKGCWPFEKYIMEENNISINQTLFPILSQNLTSNSSYR